MLTTCLTMIGLVLERQGAGKSRGGVALSRFDYLTKSMYSIFINQSSSV